MNYNTICNWNLASSKKLVSLCNGSWGDDIHIDFDFGERVN